MTDLEKLLAEVPKSGLICADYTMDNNPAWYIIPGSCVGTIATVRPDEWAMAELFAMAPELARKVIAAEKLARAARVVKNSYWNDSDGVIRGMYDLESALNAWEAAQ